ncbi:glycosyltransferase family 39 protein [Patescibacteria group bacterium]|nr:glycosyltransferase family 39 protein [Patescibacteria group bacterium]
MNFSKLYKLLTSNQKTNKRLSNQYLWILFWIALAIISLVLFSDHYLDSDEGVVLNMAWQMWLGKKLYVDFYEYLPPGSSYSIFLLWKIIGQPSYLATKIFSWLLWYLSAIFLYLITSRFTKNPSCKIVVLLSWLALSYCQTTIINHNWHSTFLAVILLFFVLKNIETPKLYLLILSGLFTTLIVWFLHTKGLFLFAFSAISYLLLLPKQHKINHLLLYLSSFFIFAFILFSPWTISSIYQNLIKTPIANQYLSTTFYDLPVIIVELFIIIIMFTYSTYTNTSKKLWLALSLFQTGLLLSIFYNTEITHLIINIFPFVIIFFAAAPTIMYRNNWQQTVFYLITVPIILFVFAIDIHFKNTNSSIFTIDILAQQNVFQTDISKLKQAKNIYAGPFLPGIYFELRKDNPYTLTHNAIYCRENCQTNYLEIFTKNQPEYALVDYQMVAKFNYDQNNPVDQYIVQNYTLCPHSIFTIQIYARDPNNCF